MHYTAIFGSRQEQTSVPCIVEKQSSKRKCYNKSFPYTECLDYLWNRYVPLDCRKRQLRMQWQPMHSAHQSFGILVSPLSPFTAPSLESPVNFQRHGHRMRPISVHQIVRHSWKGRLQDHQALTKNCSQPHVYSQSRMRIRIHLALENEHEIQTDELYIFGWHHV